MIAVPAEIAAWGQAALLPTEQSCWLHRRRITAAGLFTQITGGEQQQDLSALPVVLFPPAQPQFLCFSDRSVCEAPQEAGIRSLAAGAELSI